MTGTAYIEHPPDAYPEALALIDAAHYLRLPAPHLAQLVREGWFRVVDGRIARADLDSWRETERAYAPPEEVKALSERLRVIEQDHNALLTLLGCSHRPLSRAPEDITRRVALAEETLRTQPVVPPDQMRAWGVLFLQLSSPYVRHCVSVTNCSAHLFYHLCRFFLRYCLPLRNSEPYRSLALLLTLADKHLGVVRSELRGEKPDTHLLDRVYAMLVMSGAAPAPDPISPGTPLPDTETPGTCR
jgi:hypothetical protein